MRIIITMRVPRILSVLAVLLSLIVTLAPKVLYAEPMTRTATVKIYKLKNGKLALSIRGNINRTLVIKRRSKPIASSIFMDNGGGELIEIKERAALYQGRSLKRLGRIDKVAAAVVGDDLSITFKILRHRLKSYVIKLPLTQVENGVGEAFLFRAPTLRSQGCGDSDGANSPQTLAAQTESENGSGSGDGPPQSAAVFSPAKLFEIAAFADSYFYAQFDSNSAAKIQEVLNAAEVFYQSDIGENFDATIRIRSTQFSSTYMDELLDEFAAYVDNNSFMRDGAHLFTTHDYLAQSGGSTINAAGLAYVGVLCSNPYYSVGVSEYITGVTHIIAAHEMGHTHGANHVAGTPTTIMSATLMGSEDHFSSASISDITSYINTEGSCLASDSSNPGDGGSNDPAAPQLTLKSSIKPATGKAKGYVKLSVTNPLAEDLSSCTVNIYGSSVKSDLEISPPSGSSVVEIASFDGSALASASDKVVFRANKLSKAPSKNKLVYFNYEVDCQDTSGTGTAKKAKQGSWTKSTSILAFLKAVKSKAEMQ